MIRRKDRPGYWFRGVVDGRTRHIALGTDYQEALRRLRSLKAEGPPLTEFTVKDAAARWLQGYVATARDEKGQQLAAQRFRDHVVPYLGHLLLCRITAEHLRALRVKLERTHLSVQSVRHVLSDVRCLLNWCEDDGLIDRSPVPRKLLPKMQERPPDRLTEEEIVTLVSLPDPYGFVCRLGLGTGLRWGELVRAQAADVQNGCLVVHHTKSRKVRRVPLPSALLAEVRTRVGRLLPFANSSGFTRQVRKKSGIGRFHPHQLRHTYACRWLEAGGSLAALQELLGHSSIVTTQRYGRLAEPHVRDEVARLDGRLSPGLSPSGGTRGCEVRRNLLESIASERCESG
jgi:integrase